LIVYNIAIKILTVSIVLAWSVGNRAVSPKADALSTFVESLGSLGIKESVEFIDWRPENVGAGTRTRIWRERHRTAVVTVFRWHRPFQNLE
jgi:hypothetical protein